MNNYIKYKYVLDKKVYAKSIIDKNWSNVMSWVKMFYSMPMGKSIFGINNSAPSPSAFSYIDYEMSHKDIDNLIKDFTLPTATIEGEEILIKTDELK